MYSPPTGIAGVAEIQDIPIPQTSVQYQIGFRGVYTSELNSFTCLE